MIKEIEFFPLHHGGNLSVIHSRLQRRIDAQTAIATLRFYRPVRVERIELHPIVYGRGKPSVPVHPAHVTVSVFNRQRFEWEVVLELELPANPKFSGHGLSPHTPMEEMERFFEEALRDCPAHRIDLGGLETDHLRLECDREHPVWPNHGECNGNIYSVPFGVFKNVRVFGEPLAERPAIAPYNKILKIERLEPAPLPGMEVEIRPDMILFHSPKLAIGFSLYRPLLMHLGWDDLGEGKAKINRLLVTRSFANRAVRLVPLCGLSGPVLRTLDHDIGSHLWTGRVEVVGNQVRYRGLKATDNLELKVTFTVEPERFFMEIEQDCRESFAAVEYEAWRFAWDVKTSPTGVNGVPSLLPGRNGHVPLPVYLTGEGVGCLSLSHIDGDDGDGVHLQVESYRESEALTCGLVPVSRSEDGFGFVIPAGKRKARFELFVTNLQPDANGEKLSAGVRRHWATLFSCYRPEYRGFSNNCISVNCHLGQWSEIEVLTHTKAPENGPDIFEMLRFTVEKAVLDGGGYGYWREYFMDSDPALLCAAGGAHRIDPKPGWLERIKPGLVEIFRRMASQSGESGLLVNENLSGNSGEFTRSTNGIDTVCFGHLDAYSNAWAYRAFHNVAPLFAELGETALAEEALAIADKMRQSYGPTFINPQTGWVAGWRSRDDQLHDYAYLCINGIAIAFGLLDEAAARLALEGLENLRKEVCPISPQLGLPVNLIPHAYEDHYWPQFMQGAQPTYEVFTDGAVSSNLIEYYLRALSIYGFNEKARYLADEFDKGYAAGVFSGGVGSGNEMRSWDGIPTGYEGTLTFNHGLIYAVAVEKGYIHPHEPEWWPPMPNGY